MAKFDVDQEISKLNAELRSGRLRAAIRRKGDRLYLRATLPPKPGSGKAEPHQQEISLGVYANPAGLARAKAEALQIASDVAMERFDWGRYIKVKSAAPQTAAAWVEAFEADYFTRRARTPKSQTTWDKDYRDVFRKLPDGPLTAEVILKLIASTAPDTRSRKRFCAALGALARFAGIPLDVKPLRGSYSPKAVQPRDLPSDALIIEWRDRIPDEAWKWVYSMIAAYGLRPHECWHISPESVASGPKIEVLEGKTGRRVVLPYMPDWWQEWELSAMQLPNVTARVNRDYGLRAQGYFKRLGLPFPLYNLRHAWAARAAREGLDSTLAARMQGHRSDVHEAIYQRFMPDDVLSQAWERTKRRGAEGDA